MLIIGLILFGMLIGAGAQLILGRYRGQVDWGMALVSGLVGSFVGGSCSASSPGMGWGSDERHHQLPLGAVIVTAL